jgi:hypothetical protein
MHAINLHPESNSASQTQDAQGRGEWGEAEEKKGAHLELFDEVLILAFGLAREHVEVALRLS